MTSLAKHHGALPFADDPGDFLTAPVNEFVHNARVLPFFDPGDELQDVRVTYGDNTAIEAEIAYRAMKKENK